jgi:hypothetical protein
MVPSARPLVGLAMAPPETSSDVWCPPAADPMVRGHRQRIHPAPAPFGESRKLPSEDIPCCLQLVHTSAGEKSAAVAEAADAVVADSAAAAAAVAEAAAAVLPAPSSGGRCTGTGSGSVPVLPGLLELVPAFWVRAAAAAAGSDMGDLVLYHYGRRRRCFCSVD